MAYSVNFLDGNIAIRASAKPAALAALMSLAADDSIVRDAEVLRPLLASTTLEDALRAFDWDSHTDQAGDVVHMWMTDDQLDHSEAMFRALAPHIEPGSYVEFAGEDGDIWRWSFESQHVIETYPQFLWPPAATRHRARTIRALRARVIALRARWRAAL